MAEPSKFLKYQDKNGDFLIDECEIDVPGSIEKVCLDCKPNPKALVPNWRNSISFPFLNERLCLYQVGIETPYTETGDLGDSNESLQEKFEEFKAEAIDLFLTEYDKEYTTETFLTLEKHIQYDLNEGFELGLAAASRLKLLFSIPFEELEAIPDADEDDDEEDEQEPISVGYQASEFIALLLRVRKGLNLYARYVKYYKYIDEENIVFTKTGKLFDIDRYGDSGFNRSKMMAQVLIRLDSFLKTRGYNIPGGGAFAPFRDRVVKMRFGFDTEFKLKKLKIFTVGCADKPIVFKGRKIAALNRTAPFKDKTAMSYLAQLKEMESDLSSRAPKNFSQFLIDYTYPALTIKNSTEIVAGLDEQSCVAQAISEKANSLGQDILDDVLSLGDAIAGAFHTQMCKQLEDIREDQVAQGKNYSPVEDLRNRAKERKEQRADRPTREDRRGERRGERDTRQNERDARRDDPEAKEEYKKQKKAERRSKRDARKNARAAAAEQAYQELQANPNIYVRICADVLINKNTLGQSLDARGTWDASFNQLKQCGLFDFLLDALQCLFGGLTLEDALMIMVTKALQAMGVEDFGRLFAGLPPEEQAKLDQLVKQKLLEAQQRGDTRQTSEQQEEKDTIDASANLNPFKNINFVRPFENEELLEKERQARVPGAYESTTVSATQYEAANQNYGRRRNLGTVYPEIITFDRTATQADLSGETSPGANRITGAADDADKLFDDSKIMEAYINALIQIYADRLLDLVDRLNEFPGAEIISKALATLDCPRPPLFTPSVMDFIKDIELPFCRNTNDIALPKLYLPKISLKAILKALVKAIIAAIRRKLDEILQKLLQKICEVIGEAICKALETTGDIIGNLPGLIRGNTTFKEIIRESICGPSASEEQIDSAIQDIFSAIGGAGSELANKDKILQFNEAVASSSTRQEIIEASLGEANPDFLAIVDTIIEYEFPELREAFSNIDDIAAFYSGFGNLLPEDFKASLKDSLRGQTPEERSLPANPTLCATPDQIEEFCSVRSQILEGRASPAQIEALCRRPTEEFDALAGVLQDGIPATILDNLGPIKSTPGCDDGLFPREPDELVSQASQGLSDGLENLKIAYSYDMLGNGPFKKNWGFINMVLSDTMGRPYTSHRRKNFNDPGALQYVDFYAENEGFTNADQDNSGGNYASAGVQKGAFPKYIAEWQTVFYSQNKDNFIDIGINNNFRSKQTKFIPFKDISSGTTNGIEKRNLTRLPDFGYDYRINTVENQDEEGIKITFRPRKKDPDILLKWRDNNGGDGSLPPLAATNIPPVSLLGNEGTFQLGYNFKFFFADFDGQKNRSDDNVRMSITSVIDAGQFGTTRELKLLAKSFAGSTSEYKDRKNELKEQKKNNESKLIFNKEYEFISFDEGLDGIINEQGFISEEYPNFAEVLLQDKPENSPIVVLIAEMLDISITDAKEYWNSTTSGLLDEMGKRVFDLANNNAYRYGAQSEVLGVSDADYGVIRNGSFVEYHEAENSEGDRLSNSDAELGMSRDQYSNRDNPEKAKIIYLDPAAHGGSYTNPKFYIKPTDNSGWLGLINVMFPELSPCKPYKTDLIDFGDINSVMSNSYSTAPDDRRLLGDPDCVTEKPFDRILDRSAKAGIKGTIMAACRIYSSIAFLKSAATFSRYKPDFNNNFSNLYASYIVEEMEKSMKESQSGFAELFNPFKDEEFWYAFLEQSVQTYHDQVESGEIEEVPINVQNALREIAKIQREYKYPRGKELKAKSIGGQRELFQTKKGYRETKNLETVKAAEEHAKVILKEYVAKEVNFIADVFKNNLIKEGFVKEDDYVSNVYYHLLSEFTDGASLTLDRVIREEVTGIGDGGYTDGDEFALEDGTPYVGYYHVHEDDEGQPVFMVGEEHVETAHDVLTPFARNVQLNIGGIDASINDNVSGDKPFVIKKYLKVNGERKDSNYVSQIVSGPNPDSNISQLYPGTLDFVYEPSIDVGLDESTGAVMTSEPAESRPGKPIVGLKGELGVRHGLVLFARTPSGLREITSSEVDVLDLPIKMLKPLENGSKELLCLINKLVDDPTFKAFFSYCLPVNKLLSGIAIYNAVTFLPSIGQVVGSGDKNQKFSGLTGKPGLRIDTDTGKVDFDSSIPGWYMDEERGSFTPFSLTWDEWDKVVLRRSDTIIKRMFKSYYYSRNFDEGEGDGEKGAKLVIKNLKELFSLAPGQRIMPWWKKRASNPFNDKGELCERKE